MDNKWVCGLGVAVAILLRSCTTLHSYSGKGKPPMYGDYEAQRHWMEITVNLPADEWYRNTTDNDLLYWGLDYPPLTAYHSLLCGKIAGALNDDYVRLRSSRGYESDEHKLFMRYTVLIADLLLYVPSVLSYFYWGSKCGGETSIRPHLATVLSLLYPGSILIDHGHFQYNCVSLAFLIVAVSCLHRNRNVLASISFCLALNYKQMELYHSIPFFLYLLSICVPRPGRTLYDCSSELTRIGAAVLLTFLAIWLPFLAVGGTESVFVVLARLFPIDRGIFEDKVANVWCCANVAIKLRNFERITLFRYSTMSTLAATLPSAVDLFLRPNVKKFVPSLINSSLAFFLFSYQVHEKSILLVAIPVLLYLPRQPFACFWFLIVSVFSMFPLFLKDGLSVAYYALAIFFCCTYRMIRLVERPDTSFAIDLRSYRNFAELSKAFATRDNVSTLLCICSLSGCIGLSLLMTLAPPPNAYPDLYPLLVAVYSCVHFLGFFLFFNVQQIRIPELDRPPNDSASCKRS